MNGAEKIINAMKQVNKSNQPKQSEIVSLTVQSINPLIFTLENRLSITSEFYELSNLYDWSKLVVGDIVRAFSYNDGQTYYISEKLPLDFDTNASNLDDRIKENKSDIQTMQSQITVINTLIEHINDIYTSDGSVTNDTSDRVVKNVCSLTLNKGRYLALIAGDSSISSNKTIIIRLDGNANVSFQAGLITYRGSMQAGGGVSGWRVFEVTQSTGVVTLSAYVDNTYTIRGQLCAIKL